MSKFKFEDNIGYAISTIFNGDDLKEIRSHLKELERQAEIGRAVEWAVMHKHNWIEHYRDKLYIFGPSGKHDETPLLEAYRKAQGE